MLSKRITYSSVLELDATGIAQAIKNNELTSLEVTTRYIEHINKFNPTVNALVEDRFTEALTEAENMDKRLHDGTEKGALYGVPISVKEAYNVKKMKTTGGLINRQDFIAKADAHVVSALKKAGAIILGKTNTPTLCFCQETDNKLYGRTNNPWDLTRTAGGSSGGEGALLAAGGAAVGIGSDIGGSIRFPSHFNGVVGFKSGKFQVDSTGNYPSITIPLQKRMLGFGPMGKSVRDMKLMYNLMVTKCVEEQHLDQFDITMLPANNGYSLSDKTKETLRQIEKFLSVSLSLSRSVPPYFEESATLWQEIMSVDGAKSMRRMAFTSDRTAAIKEFTKEKFTGKSQYHPYLTWALIGADMFKPNKKRIEEIESIITEGDKKLAEYLQHRLLIFPVYHTGTQAHGKIYQEIFSIKKTYLEYMPYVAYANVWGLPSLTVPVGKDENDMPISIQIMSNNGNEDAIFQLGKRLEARFRGYIRCSFYD